MFTAAEDGRPDMWMPLLRILSVHAFAVEQTAETTHESPPLDESGK
jgi:hypothetical protein